MSRPPNQSSLLDDLLLLPEPEQLRVLSSAGPIERTVLAVVDEAGAKASREAERGLELYRPTEHHVQTLQYGNHDPGACAHFHHAWVLWLLGYPDQAQQESLRALEQARELDHPHSVAWSLRTRVFVEQCRGDVAGAEECAQALIELSREQGFAVPLAFGRCVSGWARTQSGALEDGATELRQGLASLRERRAKFWQVPLALLAEANWRVGRYDHALGALGLGVARADETGQHFWDAELHRLRAQILLDKGAGTEEEAEALFRRSLEIARSQQAKSLELRTATSYARLLGKRDQRDEARNLLAPVYEGFTEGLGTQDLKAAKELLAEKQPTRRFVSPQDIGAMAAFLCGPHGDGVTGSTYTLDGGWTAQ